MHQDIEDAEQILKAFTTQVEAYGRCCGSPGTREGWTREPSNRPSTAKVGIMTALPTSPHDMPAHRPPSAQPHQGSLLVYTAPPTSPSEWLP